MAESAEGILYILSYGNGFTPLWLVVRPIEPDHHGPGPGLCRTDLVNGDPEILLQGGQRGWMANPPQLQLILVTFLWDGPRPLSPMRSVSRQLTEEIRGLPHGCVVSITVTMRFFKVVIVRAGLVKGLATDLG